MAGENNVLVIDNDLRTIKIPAGMTNIGVAGDKEVNRLKFRMPRFYGGFDLGDFNISIEYFNSIGDGDISSVTDVITRDESVSFTWLVNEFMTLYSGEVRFGVHLEKKVGNIVEKEFSTTYAVSRVLEKVNPIGSIVSKFPSIVEKWKEDLLNRFSGRIDPSLVYSGMAADAAVTGSKIKKLEYAISSPYNFKGSCAYASLPSSALVNDTYYCTDKKCRYTWNGSGWYQSSMSESDYADEIAAISDELNNAAVDHNGKAWNDIGYGTRYHIGIHAMMLNHMGIVSIPVNTLPVYKANAYINNTGVEIDSSDFNIVELTDIEEYSVFYIPKRGNLTLPGCFVYEGNVFKPIADDRYLATGIESVRINVPKVWGDISGEGIIEIFGIKYESGFSPNNLLNSGNVAHASYYITHNNLNKSHGLRIHKIDIESGYDYFYVSGNAADSLIYGCQYDKNDNYIGNIGHDGYKLIFKDSCAYIKLNIACSKGTIIDYLYRVPVIKESVSPRDLHSVIDPSLTFEGKSIKFYGDSIARGYTSGSSVTENGFPKLFSDKVGATFVNHAIGGAMFVTGYNDVATIKAQLESNPPDSDFVVIAGGTNDYGLGATLDEFATAVNEVMNYLKNNYDGQVIFIAPINRTAASNDEKAELEEYRKIICEYCLIYEYNFINGGLFHFPDDIASASYSDLISDGLHLTEKGYRLYAKELAMIFD